MNNLHSLSLLFGIVCTLVKVANTGVVTTEVNRREADDYAYDTDDDVEEDKELNMRKINYWPNGIIPYLMKEDMYDEDEKNRILAGMRRWEYKTCVKFVPWTDVLLREFGEKRYINFFSAGACFSRTGMESQQPQLFGLGKGCLTQYTITHELGHSIGMVHTMERTDRDFYIDINYDNINAGSRRNFDTTESRDILYEFHGTPYDYMSIMHYGTKAWSSNKKPTMVTTDPAYQHIIGKVKEISFFDALYVNRAYECSKKCPVAFLGICKHGGFLGGPDCRCICQDGYAGLFCEIALPGFEHIIEWKCQRNWIFHEGTCYRLSDKIYSFSRAKERCSAANATLVIFKGRAEMEWLNHIVSETKISTRMITFWIGMTKDEDSSDIKWLDNTIVNTNIVSVTDNVGVGQPGCAKFNGENISIENCTEDAVNGYICEKPFDATCGGRYVVSDESVVIQSPGFPNGFPPDVTCTYILQTNDESSVQIKFDSFNLDVAGGDYLDVLLVNDVTADKDRYTKNSLNGETLQSQGNLAILTFKSNQRSSIAGFKATVTEIKPAGVTPASPFPLLDAIYDVFSKTNDENSHQKNTIRLKEIYNIFKSMTFSDLF